MMEKEMWDAYAKQAGGVTFDGKPLPTWDELGKLRQACWGGIMYSWQYNGAAPMNEIYAWCKDNLPAGTFTYPIWETIDFFDKESYVLFLVRWTV
jgi:hypothetical protein